MYPLSLNEVIFTERTLPFSIHWYIFCYSIVIFFSSHLMLLLPWLMSMHNKTTFPTKSSFSLQIIFTQSAVTLIIFPMKYSIRYSAILFCGVLKHLLTPIENTKLKAMQIFHLWKVVYDFSQNVTPSDVCWKIAKSVYNLNQSIQNIFSGAENKLQTTQRKVFIDWFIIITGMSHNCCSNKHDYWYVNKNNTFRFMKNKYARNFKSMLDLSLSFFVFYTWHRVIWLVDNPNGFM